MAWALPTVSITGPAADTTVSGTNVTVTANAVPDVGQAITQVQFFVDGTSIGTDGDSAGGWTVSWDTTTTSNGSHNLTAIATDDVPATGPISSPVSVTVNNVAANTAPFNVNAGLDRTITLPAGTTLSGSADDDGLPNPPGALSYSWSGPTGVSFGTPNSASTSASFVTAGTYTILLTVSDGALQATDDVIVTVLPVPNTAPRNVNAGLDRTITLPAGTTLSGSADDDGLPNPPGALSYSWSGPTGVSFGTPNNATTSASFVTAGTYTILLTVSDGALQATDDVIVTVLPVPNTAPRNVNAGLDRTITLPAGTTLSGSADDDGLPNPPGALSYSWSGPTGVSFGTPNSATTSASFVTAGTYTILLTVSDGALQATDDVIVTVLPVPNQQPTAVASGPATGTAGVSISFDGTGSTDPDGAIVSYSWNWGDGTPDTTSSSPTATHTYTTSGTKNITLTVTDDDGATDSDTAIVSTVQPVQPTSYRDNHDAHQRRRCDRIAHGSDPGNRSRKLGRNAHRPVPV